MQRILPVTHTEFYLELEPHWLQPGIATKSNVCQSSLFSFVSNAKILERTSWDSIVIRSGGNMRSSRYLRREESKATPVQPPKLKKPIRIPTQHSPTQSARMPPIRSAKFNSRICTVYCDSDPRLFYSSHSFQSSLSIVLSLEFVS